MSLNWIKTIIKSFRFDNDGVNRCPNVMWLDELVDKCEYSSGCEVHSWQEWEQGTQVLGWFIYVEMNTLPKHQEPRTYSDDIIGHQLFPFPFPVVCSWKHYRRRQLQWQLWELLNWASNQSGGILPCILRGLFLNT